MYNRVAAFFNEGTGLGTGTGLGAAVGATMAGEDARPSPHVTVFSVDCQDNGGGSPGGEVGAGQPVAPHREASHRVTRANATNLLPITLISPPSPKS